MTETVTQLRGNSLRLVVAAQWELAGQMESDRRRRFFVDKGYLTAIWPVSFTTYM
jgi:hypothetical protein